MTNRILQGLAALVLLAPVPASAAEPLSGTWRMKVGEEVDLRFAPCGEGVCGLIEDSPGLRARPDALDHRNSDPKLRTRKLKGVPFLEDMKLAGAAWKGRLYDPSSGMRMIAILTPAAPDRILLKGCIAPMMCKTFTLSRVGNG